MTFHSNAGAANVAPFSAERTTTAITQAATVRTGHELAIASAPRRKQKRKDPRRGSFYRFPAEGCNLSGYSSDRKSKRVAGKIRFTQPIVLASFSYIVKLLTIVFSARTLPVLNGSSAFDWIRVHQERRSER
jgi:hypothetical protein